MAPSWDDDGLCIKSMGSLNDGHIKIQLVIAFACGDTGANSRRGVHLQGRGTTRKRRRWGIIVGRLVGMGAVAASTAGCAFSYVDSKNVRHVIGFVDVSLPTTPTDASGPMPTAVSVTSLGMHVYSGTANGSGLVLGYGKETVLIMPNNTCVDINTPGLCAETADGRK